MRQLSRFSLIIILLLITVPVRAKSSVERKRLENTSAITRIRHGIISQGIAACEAGNYSAAVQLLEKFLNPYRIIVTSLETKGLNCLAIAYQNLDRPTLARETVRRAISIADRSTVELANLENTAGKIADRQNHRAIAIRHWEKARQLYLIHDLEEEWAKVTLQLAQNYRELGNVAKYRQLLQELGQLEQKSAISNLR